MSRLVIDADYLGPKLARRQRSFKLTDFAEPREFIDYEGCEVDALSHESMIDGMHRLQATVRELRRRNDELELCLEERNQL